MTDNINFRDLIKPGEGAMAAMQKEIARRAEAEKYTPGRWYGGIGEMLKAHGTYFTTASLPEQYADSQGEMTQCHTNALEACERHPELRYFTGLYAVGVTIHEHSWCVDPDGNVIEVTYPLDTKPGMRMAEYAGGPNMPPRPGSLGWLPPSTWVYCGLEFDTGFVRRWYDQTTLLPLLNGHSDVPEGLGSRPFLKGYKREGFAIPDDIEMETYKAQIAAAHGLDRYPDDEEDDDYNPEEPEFV